MTKKKINNGVCVRQDGFNQINRTKYESEKVAKEQYEKLLVIGVVDPSYIIYKCPVCHMWHYGLKE